MGRIRKQLHGSPSATDEKTRQASTSWESHKRAAEERRVIVSRRQERYPGRAAKAAAR